MTIRSTGGFVILRFDPGNPQFPVLPDGVAVPHILTYPEGGGNRRYANATRGYYTDHVRASAPANDRQRFAGWQTDTTWVNPAIVNFGVIPSPVRRTVSLYNARSTPIEVTALTLPTGVTLISPSLPVTLQPYDGEDFLLEASTTGENEFDEFHVFTTSEGDVTFRVIGQRVFTLNNIPQTPMRETLHFRTDLIRSTDGTEKAYGLLQSPSSTVDYKVLFTDDLARIRFKNQFIAGASELIVAGQKWYEARPLLADAGPSDTLLQISIENASFVAGGPISIVTPDGLAVSAQIESLQTSPETGNIILSAALGITAPAGSDVMPVGLGYVQSFPVYRTAPKNLEEARYSLRFNQESDFGALDPSFPTLTDLQSPESTLSILEFCNEIRGSGKPSKLVRVEDSLDSGLSNRIAFNQFPFADNVSEFRITLDSAAEVWKWRTFLHFLRGSYNEFFVPTFTNDIPDVTTSASNVFSANNTNITLLFGNPPDPRRNAIRLIYPNGTILYRFITAIVDNVQTEQITVSSAVDAGNPEIGYLQRCRILGDTATFMHGREGDVLLTFRFRTVLL